MPQMRSRREQVDAHRFITSRMNQALVLANPDSIERPLRRIGVSIFVSVMVLALIFGGFAIATLFNKGNALPEVGSIITIKGSNSVYVYTTKSGGEPTEEDPPRLWQVTNYTSALLLAKPGSDGKPPVQNLKASSLAGIARGGFTIGIQGIPTQPPDPKELLQNEDWNACSIPRKDNGTTNFQLTQLAVMDLPAPPEELGEDRWMLVMTAVDESKGEVPAFYLLWNGAKYPIGSADRPADRLIDDLNLSIGDAVPLDGAMLDSIPTGAPLAPEIRDEFNTPSEEGVESVDGTLLKYGQPVSEAGELFVLVKTPDKGDEFARITPTMEALLKTQYGATLEIDPVVKGDIASTATYLPPGYPEENLGDTLWTTDSRRPAVCAVYSPEAQEEESTTIAIAMYEQAPEELTEAAKSVEFDENGEIFHQVSMRAQTVLPQGMAVLADSRTDEGATISGFSYMVSDQGFRHGLVDQGITDSTQKLLGYDGIDPISVPNSMIELIPVGPPLDPYEARQQMAIDADDVPRYETESESAAEGG
ncbi:type VII secretion protein EccB [Glycomyces harbinensis]|uniref:Type VII secretion protein EccB n=1 Tax=Glycomyces harbinensis TaxID=58114 RepID=A0A1G7CT91_9ACTN|nr:type VII secretion protein EccB [Glycomyces harbinensis]SDE42509.1 type VII secretion protein EccB [Glycomyces harbinensis]